MKLCSKCGEMSDDGSKFCTHCGAPLSNRESTEVPAPGVTPTYDPIPEEFKETAGNPEPISEDESTYDPTELPIPAESEDSPDDSAAPVPQLTLEPFAAEPEVPAVPAAPDPYNPVPDMFKDPAEMTAAPPEPPEEPPAPQKRLRDGSLPKLSFGRGLSFVLVGILLFLLLCAPLCVFSVRYASTAGGLNELLGGVKLSTLPSDELIPGAGSESLAEHLAGLLNRSLGTSAVSAQAAGDFLDRGSFKSSFAAAAADVLEDVYAGRGENELGRPEYSRILQENSGLFRDVFGAELTAADAGNLADALVEDGFPTLPGQDQLRAQQPLLYYVLHLGCSWIILGVLGVLAIAVFIWLLKLGHSALRGFRALGIEFIVLGGLTTLGAVFSRLFPELWAAVMPAGNLADAISAGLLFRCLFPNLCLLVVGVLILVIVHVIRRAMAKHAEKRRERQERKEARRHREPEPIVHE